MQKTNILNLKNRKKIFDFIFEYPGIHLRKIIRELNLSDGTIRYHINYLIEHRLISKQEKNGFTRFYISNSHGIDNKKLISYIRNENSRAIILFFCGYACGSLKTICETLDKDKKEISVYLNKFLEDDIIESAPIEGSKVLTSFNRCKIMEYNIEGNEKVYRLKDPYKINDIIMSFRNRFLDDGSTDDILDYLLWIYKEKNNRPKKLKNTKKSFDKLEDMFFDIFPHPYHV